MTLEQEDAMLASYHRLSSLPPISEEVSQSSGVDSASPGQVDRLRQFLRVCLAYDYGGSKLLSDGLSREDWMYLMWLFMVCAREYMDNHRRSPTPLMDWSDTAPYHSVIDEQITKPAAALGISTRVVIARLRVLVYRHFRSCRPFMCLTPLRLEISYGPCNYILVQRLLDDRKLIDAVISKEDVQLRKKVVIRHARASTLSLGHVHDAASGEFRPQEVKEWPWRGPKYQQRMLENDCAKVATLVTAMKALPEDIDGSCKSKVLRLWAKWWARHLFPER